MASAGQSTAEREPWRIWDEASEQPKEQGRKAWNSGAVGIDGKRGREKSGW